MLCIPSTNPLFSYKTYRCIFAVLDDKDKAEIMRSHIEAFKESGFRVRTYCLRHQIKHSIYYYGQKKLQPQCPGQFIAITPVLSSTPLSIIFTNGTRISFEGMPPVTYLRQLMSWHVAPQF